MGFIEGLYILLVNYKCKLKIKTLFTCNKLHVKESLQAPSTTIYRYGQMFYLCFLGGTRMTRIGWMFTDFLIAVFFYA
jgi:hypothetical protein